MDKYNWEAPSYADSNRVDFPVELEDADGFWQIADIDPPTQSPFPKKDSKTKEIIYKKDASGEFLLDADGNKVPDYSTQIQITWECLELDGIDDNSPLIGATFKQFYTLSMNADSQLYKVVKAVMGGQVDPAYKPKPSDLMGRVVKATLKFGDPKANGKRWPKLDGPRVARGYDAKADTSAQPLGEPQF